MLSRRDTDSGVESGSFEVAYSLRDSGDTEPADREALAEHLLWFEQHLGTPRRFNRTTSKGFYRRRTRGVAWFKDTAIEHVARMHAITAILERYGRPVSMLSEARVGYVVFEDASRLSLSHSRSHALAADGYYGLDYILPPIHN